MRSAVRPIVRSCEACSRVIPVQHISTGSAIQRGIERARLAPGRKGSVPRRFPFRTDRQDEGVPVLARREGRVSGSHTHSADTEGVNRPSRGRNVPPSIPYTTPASEFLYGRSVIEAVLKAGRRRLYKLYFHNAEKASSSRLASEEPLIKLAHAKGVEVKSLRREDAGRLLDAMSGGRPHNGLVLEASPLPKLACTSLGSVELESRKFDIHRAPESQEESAINGPASELRFGTGEKRFPLVLLLDGILDPGNLGAIMRSAFFLGADAIALSSHAASLTSTVLKASAGATEMLPILSVHNTGNFVRSSQRKGWKFYAAMPLREGFEQQTKPTSSLRSLGAPLDESPCVVMLGGEGTGLWKDLQSKADRFVTIGGPRAGQAGVDSLNVSVSAALIIESFLRQLPAQEPANRLWGAL